MNASNSVSNDIDCAEALRLIRQHMQPGDTLGKMFMRVAQELGAKDYKCLAPAKAACAWPDCGCDPYATKVIAELVDQGWTAPRSDGAAQGQPGCGEPIAFVPLTQDGRPQWAETFAADDGCYIDYPEKWRALYAASRPIDPTEGMEALREIEIAWLSDRLSESIAGLGYPVGMGIAPHPDSIKKAATILFERYAKMIEMARRAAVGTLT